MSREAYQVPSMSGAGADNDADSWLITYVCGNCSASDRKNLRQDLIRCSDCGHRVLYKARTQRMVQFQAR